MNETEAGRVDLPAMHDSGIYRLRVVGRLGPDWKERFEGTEVNLQESSDPRGITELTVPVSDQTALLGLLGQLADMQCALLTVEFQREGYRLDEDAARKERR